MDQPKGQQYATSTRPGDYPEFRKMLYFRRPVGLPSDTMNLIATQTIEKGRIAGRTNDQIIRELIKA
tara:strand:- start:486 stop:686 length:201 start_codon:yes stop_codon:yes gene_type:complete